MPGTGPATGVVAGVDVGGTKVYGRAVDLADPGTALAEARAPTPGGRAAVAGAVADLVAELASAAPGLAAVGVGIAGLVDAEGVVRFSPNLGGAEAWPVAADVADRTGLPVAVDNDANCAARCEQALGALAGVGHGALLTLGTGIGGGLVLDGRLDRGAHGLAAEPGHVVVDPAGPPCRCGSRGCWEQLASGTALGRLGRRAAASGGAPRLVALAGGDPGDVTGEHVAAAAAEGDPVALAAVGELARWLGLGVANLVTLLDLEVVVVGGGLAAMGELLLAPARRELGDRVLGAGHRPPPRLVRARLGPEAGAVGAALVAGAER